MLNSVEQFLDKYKLNDFDSTILVGFSGGYDSLCLLDILYCISLKYKFNIIALHLNHNWRGGESLQDELNCKSFCEKIGINFISETLAEDGDKTENFAREARYNFFLKHARDYKNSSVFTAHTQSDNTETLIYRIIKGTGVKGLQGILPKRTIGETAIYRPLLNFTRKNIEDYCDLKGLIPNNDSSNLDVSYKRNFIRHKIMPLFLEININATNSIDSLAKIATSQINIVDEYMRLIKKDVLNGEKILTPKFKNLSKDVRQQFIYDLFLSNKLNYDFTKISNVLNFIENNFNSKSGSRCSLTNNLWLFVNSKYIYLITKISTELNRNETNITNVGEYPLAQTNYVFLIEKYSDENFKFPQEYENFAYINLDPVDVNLTIRTRRDGDIITPFGMNGSMKLKKYLNSKGIAKHERDGLIVLAKGTEILWVVGVGLSDKLKVVNKPTHMIKLEIRE